MKRKKICPKCGRKLWLRDFYKSASGNVYPICKECAREQKREAYNRTRKKKDCIYKADDGRLMNHQGVRTSIYWSSYMIEQLKRKFPVTKNAELAECLNVSPRTLIRKARELGIYKNEEWQRQNSKRHVQMAILTNKVRRNSGMIQKGEHKSPDTEFKKKVV